LFSNKVCFILAVTVFRLSRVSSLFKIGKAFKFRIIV